MERLGTVVVVGVGLIGGSIGRALRARGLAERVVGVGRSVSSLEEAVRVGALDGYAADLAAGVEGAEVVVVCTPVPGIAETCLAAARAAPPDVLVTDAGSTKRSIVAAVEADVRGRSVFVGGHPVAGSEKKGPAHADPDLFVGRACVVTRTGQTPPDRLARARAFWGAIGGAVVELDPEAHDAALALTSHLPHAVASALAAAVPAEALALAAGAYRDGTRVAASDADLWAGIFLDNRAHLLDALDRFEGRIGEFRAALCRGDAEALRAVWDVGRARRARFPVRPPADRH